MGLAIATGSILRAGSVIIRKTGAGCRIPSHPWRYVSRRSLLMNKILSSERRKTGKPLGKLAPPFDQAQGRLSRHGELAS